MADVLSRRGSAVAQDAITGNGCPLVKIWKSIGLFGEDGMEALHPKWRDAMLMVRSMRNPEAKLKAGLDKLHMQMRVLGRK